MAAEPIRLFAGPLLHYVYTLLPDDFQLAEDIVQETFLCAWQRLGILDGPHSSVGPWLFTVARTLVDDHRRARPPDVCDPELRFVPGNDSWPDSVEATIDLRRALDRLSPEHRAVLVQKYYRDRTLADIARRIGVPPGTVKSRTHYALRCLHDILANQG